MRIYFLKPILIITLIYSVVPGVGYSQRKVNSRTHQTSSIQINPIKDSTIIKECGCWFYVEDVYNKKEYIYGQHTQDSKSIWMNIDGKDTKFSLDKTIVPGNKTLKVGDHYAEKYSNGKIHISIRYTILSLCAPENDNCESESMDAEVTVTKGKRQGKIKLTGECGCG